MPLTIVFETKHEGLNLKRKIDEDIDSILFIILQKYLESLLLIARPLEYRYLVF